MANTYTQLAVHVVTAVKHRRCLIHPDWRLRIEAAIRKILEGRKHHVVAIYLIADHIHILIGMHPTDSVSDMVAAWKAESSGFIQRNFHIEFEWQRGYGAFSVSKSIVPAVTHYIERQAEHHSLALSFRKEYIDLLQDHDIVYDERYLFEDVYLG